jgi:hypothetical protein
MDQSLTVWTTCQATVEEKWVIRTSADLVRDPDTRTILELLSDEDVEVLSVENIELHSERERSVMCIEIGSSLATDHVA